MKRTASNPASPEPSVHVNGSSVTPDELQQRANEIYAADVAQDANRRPKRKWRPEVERDRSMRAYEQNPRALANHLDRFGDA